MRVLALGGVAGFVLYKRRREHDRVEAASEDRAVASTAELDAAITGQGRQPPPAPAAVAEPSPAGRAEDAVEQPPPVQPPSAPPPAGGDALVTPAGAPRGESVQPDQQAGDPLVDEQTAAAAAQAAAIGGEAQPPDGDETGFPGDPAMRPVAEASGDAEETLEASDEETGGHRERRS